MHRFLNVVYSYLVESVRRPDQSLRDAALVVDGMIAPPPSPEEQVMVSAQQNQQAMAQLGALLDGVRVAG